MTRDKRPDATSPPSFGVEALTFQASTSGKNRDSRTRPPITLTLSPEARSRLESLSKEQRRTMSGTVEWLIMGNDHVRAAVEAERRACAAYCLDRADQYETKSGTWVGIADCAEGIAKGEAAEAMWSGDTEDLLKRVQQLAGFTRPTPKPRDKGRKS